MFNCVCVPHPNKRWNYSSTATEFTCSKGFGAMETFREASEAASNQTFKHFFKPRKALSGHRDPPAACAQPPLLPLGSDALFH